MRARRTDAKHKAVLDAIRALGYPCMSLHAHGKGLEDILVGMPGESTPLVSRQPSWLLVEVKTVLTESTGRVKFTPAQREWYAQTEGFPRLVVTSAQDAVDQLRRMAG